MSRAFRSIESGDRRSGRNPVWFGLAAALAAVGGGGGGGGGVDAKAAARTAPEDEAPRAAVVAHRGASDRAPENTLAAFKLAWELEADAIEGDFLLSKDGVIVTSHDKTTKRIAGVDKPVVEQTLEELRRLDVGVWKDERFRGERMPTLEEVFAVVPEGKYILVEVKCGPEIVPELKRVIAASGLSASRIRIIAFDPEVIAECKRALDPAIKAYWLSGFKIDRDTGEVLGPPVSELIAVAREIKADGLDLQYRGLDTRERVREILDAGLELHVWTVDDPEVARRLVDWGVQSVTTNVPDVIRAAIRGRGAGASGGEGR